MNVKQLLQTLSFTTAVALSAKPSLAILITFDAGTPSAAANPMGLNSTPGTVAIGEVASHVSGGGLTGIATCWPSGAPCDPGGVAVSTAQAASAIDHYWVQYISSLEADILFQFTTPTSDVVAVAGVDHFDPLLGEIPGEAIEFIVFGTNDLAFYEQGAIIAVYDLGVDGGLGPNITGDGGTLPLGTSDDYSSLWHFSQPYQYFLVTSGDHIAGFSSPDEGEIDGLAKPAQAPEPGTLLLLGAGLLAALVRRRRR
jgi:hypothetical protein